jgi:hypothetical protein
LSKIFLNISVSTLYNLKQVLGHSPGMLSSCGTLVRVEMFKVLDEG